MSRYHDCPFHHGRLVAARLAILAGIVCILTQPAKANIVVQTKGLQRGVTAGTSVRGQIAITNGLPDDAEQVGMKLVELVPTTYRWEAVDPNDPNNHHWPKRESSSQSCVKWVSLTQAEVTVKPMAAAVIPVEVDIPKDANGLYRCGVRVHVPSPNSSIGVVVGYDVVVPILLEVAKSVSPVAAESQPKDFAVAFPLGYVKVAQDGTSSDPYHTYAGVSKLTITTTSPLHLSVSAEATSAAGGSWSATVDPASFSGTTEIKLGARGTDVSIDRLVGGAKDVHVAEISVQVMPNLAKSPFLWRDKDQNPSPSDPNEDGD
jgi:hypothetical protein